MNKLTLFLLLCFSGYLHADQVNKCIDSSGYIAYQSLPCQGNTTTERLEVDNTPDPNYVPESFSSSIDADGTQQFEDEVKNSLEARDQQLKESRLRLCEMAKNDLETYRMIRDLGAVNAGGNKYLMQSYDNNVQMAESKVARYCH